MVSSLRATNTIINHFVPRWGRISAHALSGAVRTLRFEFSKPAWCVTSRATDFKNADAARAPNILRRNVIARARVEGGVAAVFHSFSIRYQKRTQLCKYHLQAWAII